MVQYRELRREEISRELFGGFIRRQDVTKCWRRAEGRWVIRDAPFVDDWTEEEYGILVGCLRNTAATGGFVCRFFRRYFEGLCICGNCAVWRGAGISGSVLHPCVGGYAGKGNRQGAFPGGEELGKGTWGPQAVYIRPFRRGKPGLLPGDGMRGGTGVPPGSCGSGTL